MSKEISIESDIPFPERKPKNVRLYPWIDMKPGDSFLVFGRTAACAARGSFRRYQKMGKIPADWRVKQFVVEGEARNGMVCVRMWLVEE